MSALLYYPVYLTILTLLTLYQYNYYRSVRSIAINARKYVSPIPSLFLAIVLTFFIGLRPQAGIFVDMNNYIAWYIPHMGDYFIFDPEAENFLFDNLYSYMACSGYHWKNFFLVIAAIYYGGMWVACRKLFPRDTLVAFLACAAAFSTFSYGTNGVKAGAAASLFLIAMAYWRNWKVFVPFLFLSLGFHHSMVMPIVAFGMAYLYRQTKHYFYAWAVCLLMAMLHVTFFQTLFAGMSDESGAGYLMSDGSEWGGKEGFRIDFVLYSAMPVLVGYWIIFKRRVRSVFYEFLLSIYLTTNAVWMLCMYANFTNRIAYLSWFMYPVVLIYPFFLDRLGPRRYKQLALVVLLHLLFTIFMHVVYY